MTEQARHQVGRNEPHPFATRDDFIKVFHEDMNGLYQLSFLLTGDHEKAEKCFVAGIEDCVKENRVPGVGTFLGKAHYRRKRNS